MVLLPIFLYNGLMNIVVAFNPVEYEDKRRAKAQENAILALSMAPRHVFPVAFGFHGDKPNLYVKSLNIPTLNILKKDSSQIIGNDRRLPYIDEIMSCCCKLDCGVFGYINSDILLNNMVWDEVIHNGNFYDAYILERYEIGEVNNVADFMFENTKPLYGGDKHDGNDAFFLSKKWYFDNKNIFDQFPLTIGESDWDTCYRFIIKKRTKCFYEGRVLYHVYHAPKWTKISTGAKHNISMLKTIGEL